MTQNVCVSVQMDEKGFRDFASFDLLRHNKGWQRPAVFTAILLVCAGICLSQIGKREGAGLLTAVLAIVAIGLPAVYFGTFFSNLSKQIKKLGLPRPFYRLELDAVFAVEDHGRDGGGKVLTFHPVEYHIAHGDLSCQGFSLRLRMDDAAEPVKV